MPLPSGNRLVWGALCPFSLSLLHLSAGAPFSPCWSLVVCSGNSAPRLSHSHSLSLPCLTLLSHSGRLLLARRSAAEAAVALVSVTKNKSGALSCWLITTLSLVACGRKKTHKHSNAETQRDSLCLSPADLECGSAVMNSVLHYTNLLSVQHSNVQHTFQLSSHIYFRLSSIRIIV